MPVEVKKKYLNLYSPQSGYAFTPKARANDRRSHRDRRKAYMASYFLKGGIERRRWKERRYLWYQTL